MRPSSYTAGANAGAAVIILAAVALAGALAWGAVPGITELFVWLATIVVLAGLCIFQGRRLHGRQSDLEDEAAALAYRSQVLDNFDKQLKRREWAVIWGEARIR